MPVKVVHISTYVNGGAGSAAYRLHKALLKSEIDSYFISLESTPVPDGKAFKLKRRHNSLFQRAIKKVASHVNLVNNREATIKKFEALYPSLKCSFASLPFSNYDILDNPVVKDADIIHLHWIAGMVDYTRFFKKNNKPVAWTLHDMNPMKGLYHYDEDEKRNEAITGALNRKIHALKLKAIQHRHCQLSYITPSHWLEQEVERSETFKGVKGSSIPNPVDTDFFKPRDTGLLRTTMNIPKDHTVFLFIAESIKDYRKGFDILVSALNELDGYPFTLLAIGEHSGGINISGNINFLGSTTDSEQLSEYYSLADALIIPSREDNLPNVMVEAIACGTPVLSFNVGGMATTIQDQFNGLTAKEISVSALKNLLIEFMRIKDCFDTSAIRKFAVDNFSENIVVEKYKDVYNTLLNSH